MKRIIAKLLFVLNPQPTRGMMQYVKKNLKGPLRGAEIGVAEGFHVFKYLKTNKNIELVFLVDPYEAYVMDKQVKNYAFAEEDAKKRLSIYESRIVWFKGTSKDASRFVPHQLVSPLLDFVYIDANHEYISVKEDIELWYPLVKKGGILGGHDFSASFPGVAKAVLEFVEKNKLKLHGNGADWWVCKQ